MEQSENNSRPWWKKIKELWSPESSTSRQARLPQSDPPDSKTDLDSFEQGVESKIQADPGQPSPQKQQVGQYKLRLQARGFGAAEAAQLADPKRSAPNRFAPKPRISQYQRFQERMARREQEAFERKALAKKELVNKKRAADVKRLRLVREHKEALRLKKMQCRNTWGRLESDEWNRVLEQFLRTVLRASNDDWPHWKKRVNSIVGTALLRKAKLNRAILGSSFEFEVAAQLRAFGWSVQLLGKSGDQGGDLLAQKGDKSVVVQCKNYTGKVGNAAVQEVAAAKQFYHACSAVVVCGNGFTRQAEALADKTSVLLLAPDQLSVLG